MKTTHDRTPHRRLPRALTAVLAGMLLTTSLATAQESPVPATQPSASEPPAATQAPATQAPATQAPGPAESPAAVQPEPSPEAATTLRRPRRWSLADMPDRRAGWILNDVIAGGPGFIAVGGGSAGRARSVPQALIWVSDRGREWQTVPLFGPAAQGVIRAITATDGGYVAVGDGRQGAAVWISADGVGWQRVPHADIFDGAAMLDVVDGPAGLIAVGCAGNIECASSRAWRSDDGSTWESLEPPPPGLPQAIEATASGYLVAGMEPTSGDPALASGVDGRAWQPAEGLPGGPALLAALGGAAAGSLAGGNSSESGAARGLLLESADGLNWRTVGHRTFRAAEFADVASSEDGVMLLGSRSQRVRGEVRARPLALWSADLDAFRVTPFPAQSTRVGGEVNAAAFSADGSLLVAVGATGRPLPSAWFSRMATPRVQGDSPTRPASPASTTPSPGPASPAAASPAPASAVPAG